MLDNKQYEAQMISGEQKENDLIESCIAHILTSIDIDEWAAKIAEKALREYQLPRVMTMLEVAKWAKTPAEMRDPVYYQSEGGNNGRWIVNTDDVDKICKEVISGHSKCWTKRPLASR